MLAATKSAVAELRALTVSIMTEQLGWSGRLQYHRGNLTHTSLPNYPTLENTSPFEGGGMLINSRI